MSSSKAEPIKSCNVERNTNRLPPVTVTTKKQDSQYTVGKEAMTNSGTLQT